MSDWILRYIQRNPEALLLKTELIAIEIWNKTACKEKSGHYSIGILWKSKNTKSSYNRQIADWRLKSLENKFKKEPEFCQNYQQTIESYLKNGYVTKLNTKLYNENKEILNYTPHHRVKNVNKSGKIPVVFGARAKYNYTLLNKNLLQGLDLLRKIYQYFDKISKRKVCCHGLHNINVSSNFCIT